MLNARRGTVLLLGAALVGCTASSDRDVTAPRVNAAASARDDAASAGGAQQQVTGHANIQLPLFANAVERYSNSAIRHAGGTVSGEFELKSAQDGGLRVHGNVVCFTIVGNTARLAGEVEQSNTPIAPPGAFAVWTIVDNGEGNKDPPDLTSDFFTTTAAAAAFHCAVGFNLAPLLPVLSGNLQVHE